MKHDEANRRIQALVDFRQAIDSLLDESLTGQTAEGARLPLGAPRPGRQAEWAQARARVDQLAMKAGRSFDDASVWLDHKPPGTWDTRRVNPALMWHECFRHDAWFDLSMLEQLINRAIGRLEDLRDDPPRRRSIEIPLPSWSSLGTAGKWVAGAVATIGVGVATGGILYWLGWI